MKTKIFFLTLAVLITANPLFSQESIIKKDNSVMKVKILEIQENSIKYKPIDFLDGPVRSISLSEVSHIVYDDGKIESFNDSSAQNIPEQSPSSPQKINSSHFQVFARISGQTWSNEGFSEFFGTNLSFGAGVEKSFLGHLKVGASLDFASKSQYEVTLTYTQFGGFVKLSWGNFDQNIFLIYTELGAKGVSIKDTEYGESFSATGFGFSVAIGADIRLTEKLILDLRWDTTWASVDVSGYKAKLNNDLFSAGIIFSL